MSEFYTISKPISRKAYRCEECRADIKTGERYARHSGKQEGYMFDVKVCLRCQGMRSAAWEVFNWDEGPMFGELRQEIRDETGRDADAWYDEWCIEKAAQSELARILAESAATYQHAGRPRL